MLGSDLLRLDFQKFLGILIAEDLVTMPTIRETCFLIGTWPADTRTKKLEALGLAIKARRPCAEFVGRESILRAHDDQAQTQLQELGYG